MVFENIIFEQKERYAVITFNRPKALNALNHALLRDIDAALDEIEQNPDIWGLIVTGEGRSFIAGGDIKEIPVGDAEAERSGVMEAQRVINRIAALEIPVIAAINGYALGGGNELALACDIRIASTDAVFGQPEVTLGVNACYGGPQRLTRLIGAGMAKELFYTARRVKAQEAREIGLVNRVVEPEVLMPEAEQMMRTICSNSPKGIKYTKLAIDHGNEMSLPLAFEMERDMAAVCVVTEDMKEGVTAFLEKRKPVFKNK